MLVAMESIEMEPQIMAPRVTPMEGVSTYALRGIGVRGVEKPQGFGIDERRLITSAHRKDRKAQQQSLNFCMEKHLRNRTRMTRIARIFADNRIRGHPRHPRNPCSITFALEGKRGY